MYRGPVLGRTLGQFVNLGMAVVAGSNAIIGSGGDNLIQFPLSVLQAFLFIGILQESTTAAATIVVGHVRIHIDEVFFTDAGFEDKPEILCQGIAKGFPHQVTGILGSKFNF